MDAQSLIKTMASDKSEARQALFDNEPIASFLEQVFDMFAEEDSRGHAIQLTAPSWWGLARLMKIMNNTMSDAVPECK